MNEACGGPVAPSAAGHFEPYNARVLLWPNTQVLEPEPFLKRLLEDLAGSCLASGASQIGHLKCLLHTPAGVLACNLTSARSGASCALTPGTVGQAAPLLPGDAARLDLAVLVYGLAVFTIDTLARRALADILDVADVSWSISASCDAELIKGP